ncbi:hypothetical protein GC101_34110 [Paenibacillus sp. LMG 31459]|uniref:Restriction endonuclease type IV Mrr domain-containing protein n=1 Tax=Paenibacillus phytohabitans TaxID=2654978 RepID=A0ABX1YSL6_9BACL|nr:hypothetical protein [Paenibacillus phytohabitans]NOU83891.1 hypothetical protein [Paenibacillus phytohabitans]
MFQSPSIIVNQIDDMYKKLEKLDGEQFLYEVVSVHKTLIGKQYTKNIMNNAVEEFRMEHRKYVQYKKKKVQKLEGLKEIAIDFLYELYQLSSSPTELRLPQFPQFFKLTKEEYLKKKIYSGIEDITSSKYEYEYEYSFNRFDNLLKNEKFHRDKFLEIDPIIIAVRFLRNKFDEYKKKDECKEWFEGKGNTFIEELNNFEITCMQRYRNYLAFSRRSLGADLIYIEGFILRLNPTKKLRLFSCDEDANEPHSFSNDEASNLLPALFGQKFFQSEPEFKKICITISGKILNVLHKVKIQIDEYLSIEQVVEKFKIRCMWYDKDRIRSLIDSSEPTRNKNEDILMKEMALYLFDNGYPVLSKIQTENLQTDLMDFSKDISILIECKVYQKNCRDILIKGIAQLHSYLNNFENSHFRITKAYYVVFRTGGPLYDFPKEIPFQRFSIIPYVIDLGDSKVSGSRQSEKPNIISLDEIIQSTKES